MHSGREIARYVPALRRYARALAGNQVAGDRLVETTLRSLVEQAWSPPTDIAVRTAIYRAVDRTWRSDAAASADGAGETGRAQVLMARLAVLSTDARRALLLTALEDFSTEDTAVILDSDLDTVQRNIDEGLAEIEAQTRASVLIIEDEPLIAMDIETIVEDLGHDVVGIATTRDNAVQAAHDTPPSLVLADIQLADNSSGIDAVTDILADHRVPVVFITAFPERLLTGVRPEPTFLLAKPFQRRALQVTIAQALLSDPGTAPAMRAAL